MYKTCGKFEGLGGIVWGTCRTVPDCCGSIPMQVVGVLCDVSIVHLHLHHDKISSITSLLCKHGSRLSAKICELSVMCCICV